MWFVVATVVGAVALQVAANHARGLAFADLLLARLAFACIANAVGLFTALCLFAALGESTIRALVVAARLLSPGLLAGFSLLLPGALFAGAAPCMSAPGVRSEDGRVGKECVRTWNTRWATLHIKTRNRI